jgi:GT2 family glycosyltransferase
LNTATLLATRHDGIGVFEGDPGLGWGARLREALAASDSSFLLLLAPGVHPDAFTLSQLADALATQTEAEAVSPVSVSAVIERWDLSTGDDAVLEAWTWAPHVALPARPDPRCTLWTRAGAQRLVESGDVGTIHARRLPHVAMSLVGDSTSEGRGVDALPNRNWRPGRLVLRRPAPTRAGRNGQPVILHVLHDWGGGVSRFVADQMRDDPEAVHLALVSGGDVQRGFGQQLALHVDLDACPIRLWACELPVGDTAETHPIVRTALAQTFASFGVSAIRVSSLIGSTLDVLRTGLPTAFVVHDPFPFWPVLDDVDALPTWDADRLQTAMSTSAFRFTERSTEVWRQRSAKAIAALRETKTVIVAPSRAAAARLAALAPDLPAANVIPHGLPSLGDGTYVRPSERRAGPLRVLVPGRLEGGKGERLLDALLPIAPRGIEWTFAGGGALAEAYAERLGGRAMADYRVADLPRIIDDIDPDIALLPSLLPETFGYVLSEMHGLGVPVLAAAGGAYGERIDARANGLAPVAPDAAAFAAALLDVADSPARLPRRIPPPPRIDDARDAWRTLQPLSPRTPRCGPFDPVATVKHLHGTLLSEVEHLRRERDEAYLAHERDTNDLIAQRDTAVARAEGLMQELVGEREHHHEHVVSLESEVERERQRINGLRREREALEVTLQSLHASLAQIQNALDDAGRERDLAYGYYERDTADLIRQRDVAMSQRDAAQEQLAQAQRILAHPLVRWPLRVRERGGDLHAAWRYRLSRGVDLVRRGVRSLKSRGLPATWAAVVRRFAKRPAPAPTTTAPVESPLAFTAPVEVRASLVIPVYGKLAYTMACLRSLAQTRLPEGTEIIVVDDASPDDTGRVLPAIPGLRYHRNATNLGFVGSCNAGAALARGAYLVFVNNDTTLTPGWLETLLRTFETHPDSGLVGAQLVYPDGRLQESGGIVFSDGSGWNYGRFEDPQHPAFTFVREVDYCSGAAIAIPRALFERLGGFDARYAPAYYEDTDLAMKVREAGLKVRVQPASVVIHHEGITAGTDTGSGIKAYQVRNQQRFFERWRSTLARRHPAPTQAPHYAAQHRARARVLVIDATTPMPDRDSGSVRLFELLRLLVSEGCAVTFFAENGLDDGRYTQALRDIGVEAWAQPWLGAVPEWLAKNGPRFQLVIVSRHYILSPLLPLLRRHAPQARIVFDTVDLHHLREQREADERNDAGLQRVAARTRADELALIGAVDRTWVVSPVEKALLAESAPGAIVDVVSNIHRVRGAGPAMGTRSGLLFVGGFRHPPNVDAALWLADDILPRIRAARPDIALSLVGSDAPPAVLALGERDGITVHGHVPDLEPLIDAHRFSIAPLRYGAGVKGKINQALAHGLPVVATRCAVEGMGLQHGVDALVADDAQGLADAVLAAYDDEALWLALVQGGLDNTEREFSPERARATLRMIFNELR